MSRSLKAHLLLLAATFVWGSTFIVIKSALADATPLVFNAVRMTFAASSSASSFSAACATSPSEPCALALKSEP